MLEEMYQFPGIAFAKTYEDAFKASSAKRQNAGEPLLDQKVLFYTPKPVNDDDVLDDDRSFIDLGALLEKKVESNEEENADKNNMDPSNVVKSTRSNPIKFDTPLGIFHHALRRHKFRSKGMQHEPIVFSDVVDEDATQAYDDYIAESLVGYVLEHDIFRRIIMVAILLNSVLLGLETDNNFSARYNSYLMIADKCFITIFVLEILMKVCIFLLAVPIILSM
jgi:hypothetical protein